MNTELPKCQKSTWKEEFQAEVPCEGERRLTGIAHRSPKDVPSVQLECLECESRSFLSRSDVVALHEAKFGPIPTQHKIEMEFSS